jgi:hypothetical protein
MMPKILQISLQPALIPSRITLRTEKRRSSVIVYAVDHPALTMKIGTYLRANKAR